MKNKILLLAAGLWGGFAAAVTIQVVNPPDTLNPHLSVSLEGHIICKQVYQAPLLRNLDGSFSPQVVQKWSFSGDRKTLRLEIDPTAKFSNGQSVTTGDLEQSFARSILFRNNEEILQIVGSEAIHSDQDHLAGFTTIHPLAATIRFKAPAQNFLSLLSELNFAITFRNSDGSFLGTGPYRIANISGAKNKMESVELKRNSFSRLANLGPESAKFVFGPSGEADLSVFEGTGRTKYIEYLDAEVDFLGFNLADKRFQSAENREQIYKILAAARPLLASIIPKGLLGYDPKKSIHFMGNPSGHAAKLGPIEVSSYVPALADEARDICTSLAAAGLSCSVRTYKLENVLDPKSRRKNLQIFIGRLKPSIPTVEDIFQAFQSGNKINFLSTKYLPVIAKSLDHQINALNSQGTLTTDQRLVIYHQIDHLITDNLLAIPLSYGHRRKFFFRDFVNMPNLGVMGLLDLNLTQIQVAR